MIEKIEWSNLYELNNEVSHGKINFHQACELYAEREVKKYKDILQESENVIQDLLITHNDTTPSFIHTLKRIKTITKHKSKE